MLPAFIKPDIFSVCVSAIVSTCLYCLATACGVGYLCVKYSCDLRLQLVFEEQLERAREKEEKEAKKRQRLVDDFTDLLRSFKVHNILYVVSDLC